ncbi:MAG: hypothetical protein LBI01_03800 [Elusimicrobium sp.]|jgi:hypothetical protein|nr:hypothetical protein [Elusimicrobium sp.]
MERLLKFLVILLIVIVGLKVGCSVKSDFKDKGIINSFQAAQDEYYKKNNMYADSFKKLGFTFDRSVPCGESKDGHTDCFFEDITWPAVMIKRFVYFDISEPKEGYKIIVSHNCDGYRFVGAQTKAGFTIRKERF